MGVIILGYMLVYNLALKAEYAKGEYKSRFYKMTKVDIKDFNAIHNNMGSMFGMELEYGPEFGVWVKNDVKDAIVFNKKGKTLNINFDGKHEDYHYGGNMLVITCPVLDSVSSTWADTLENRNFWSSIVIRGFKQNALKLYLGPLAKIYLDNNSFDTLNAFIIGNNGAGTFDDGLSVKKNNIIGTANISTPNNKGYAHIKLDDPSIQKVNYQLGDSARLTVTGKLLRSLK